MLLGACASIQSPGTRSQYAFDNSVAAACRNNPAQCAPLKGAPSATGSGIAVGTAGYAVHKALEVLDNLTKSSIEEALKKCADEARTTVLLRYSGHFKGVGPTAAECREWVQDKSGRRVTWAARLGLEMHEVALECAKEALGKLRPGGFSIEPRYHYDPQTGKKRLISPEEEQALIQSGNSRELRGTLKPDVVLHAGDPLKIQAIYDFKFPCANTTAVPPWTPYGEGHPYQNSDQGTMYEKLLGVEPARVAPWWGIIR
ncbi:MAG: hypothetical protein JXB05_11535 [Myxococcaceae bacterium]|nr:hypothetical protein [Myxococcaceae bacterium]